MVENRSGFSFFIIERHFLHLQKSSCDPPDLPSVGEQVLKLNIKCLIIGDDFEVENCSCFSFFIIERHFLHLQKSSCDPPHLPSVGEQVLKLNIKSNLKMFHCQKLELTCAVWKNPHNLNCIISLLSYLKVWSIKLYFMENVFP